MEARCFVEQAEDAEVSCVEYRSGHPHPQRLHSGPEQSHFHFYPEDRGRHSWR